MISRIETLPNEIFLHIFSSLTWYDMLTSFWSLNTRFNSLICSTLTINNNPWSNGVITHGLSYNQYCSRLIPFVLNSSSLSSSIQHIHLDGINSIASDFCYEWLFSGNILHFPHLKSLIISRCGAVEPLFQRLTYLIKYQLDELALTFDRNTFTRFYCLRKYLSDLSEKEKQLHMIKQFVCQLFSGECHLTSLRLDISNEFRWGPIHKCLSSKSDDCRNFLIHSCNTTLQRLHIRLNHSCFLENLIEYVPNLEQLSVKFYGSLTFNNFWEPNIETLSQSTKSWFNKVPKLNCFSLDSLIDRERELIYLKWLLNNFNYVKKLQVNIQIGILTDSNSQNIWKSLVDANFVRQYCLPDIIPNLTDFNFYICSQCQLSDNDTWKIINSFNIHSFFIDRQWTNVKCLFDSLQSYQHLFFPSSNMFQSSDKEIDRLYISKQLRLYDTSFYSYSSLHLFLEKLSQLSRHISDINVYKVHENDLDKFDLMMSLEVLSEMRQNMKLNNPFRNVTKIQFGMYFDCKNSTSVEGTDGNEVRGKVLAHLISMTTQLKYLLVERFEWLLHVIQHAPNELRTNALTTVQYAEFCLSSCHNGYETIHIGKSIVPFLSTYMPHLQALRLWRPDDFVWTTIRPDYVKYRNDFLMLQWLKSLQTCESIAQHVLVFEQDLCQLTDKLKDLTFLDIYGEIHYKKVEPYRLMAQTCFPRSRVYVEMSRFRIWF